MEKINTEKLFIRLSPRIRKQLEILEEKDQYSYYEALGINRDFTPDDLDRGIKRTRELLERLKFHPQFKDESQNVFQFLCRAAEILKNPATKTQYDSALQSFFQQGKARQREKFRSLIEITLKNQSFGPEQKKALLLYTLHSNIDIKTAQSILDSFPTQNLDSELLVASPPCLSAPIPRFMETQAFQIILKKCNPILQEISILKCSCCGKENPVTYLTCSCGSLMRGKMICLGCALLFSIKDSQCPKCTKESQIMLKFNEEDLQKTHHYIQVQVDRHEKRIALNTCHDLLQILPGNHKIKILMQDLQHKLKSEEAEKEKKNIEAEGIRAWEEKKVIKTYRRLKQASKLYSLSEKAKDILVKASLELSSKLKRISFFFLLISFLLFIFSVIISELEFVQNDILKKSMLYGFSIFFALSMCFRLYFTFIFKKSLEKTTISKSSQNPSGQKQSD